MATRSLTQPLLETLSVFDGQSRGTPLTTSEVSERLDLGRRGTYARLERLVDQGVLETKKVGARGRVWWRTADGAPPDVPADSNHVDAELAHVLERIDDGFYALDDEWRFTYLNERAEEITGFSEAELLGADIWETFTHLEGTLAEERFREALETGRPMAYEDYLPESDEWIDVRLYPSESGLSVYFRDVTEGKERERELERYETIVETVSDGIYAVDADSRFVYVNEAFCELVGYDREELIGEHSTLVVEEDRIVRRAEELADEVLAGGRDLATIDLELPLRDGTTIPVETRFSPYPIDDEFGRCGVVRDARESRDRERELRESERRVRTLVDNFPDGVIALYEPDLRHTLVGGEVFDLVDLSPDEIEGKTVREIFPSDVVDEIEPHFEAVFDGERREFEVQAGEKVRAFRTIPVRDESGEIVAGLGMSQDVTPHKRRERELERKSERLSAVNDLNGVVREVVDAVTGQSTREEIEAVVCERLARSDSYLFAWIGDVDPGTRTVNLRTEAGVDGYLDGVSLPVDPEDEQANGPLVQAFLDRELQVTRAGSEDGSWPDRASERGALAAAAIPVHHDTNCFGVLNVYADRPNAFTEDEQAVVGQLGEVVGQAISAVERKRALMSDEVVETVLVLEDVFESIGVSADADGTILIDRTVAIGDDSHLVYGRATEDGLDSIRTLVESESVPHWESVTVLGAEGEETDFELRMTEQPVLSTISAHGGRVQEMRIEEGEFSARVQLPPSRDLRQVINALRKDYPTIELMTQRQVSRDPLPTADLARASDSELTDRQRIALEAAYHAGYFEWPRTRTGQEVADSIGIDPSTFHYHLRNAQRETLGRVIDAWIGRS